MSDKDMAMNINRVAREYAANGVTGARRPSKAERPAVAGEVRPAHQVDISAAARELAKARQAVEAAPEVRAEKVAQIKKSIEDGTYSVSPDLLARKLLGELRRDG